MKTKLIIAGVGLIFGLFLLNPFMLSAPHIAHFEIPSLPSEIDSWLAQSESKFPGLKEAHKKSIRWKDLSGSEYSIVYLHGFSATKVEISPVVENLSEQLKANTYFARLTGHGLSPDEFGHVSSDNYFNDAEEAYQIAKKLGKKIVLIGTSTGATLATYLAAEHPDIYKLILISPNFGLNEPESIYLGGPLGPIFTRVVVGKYRSWKPISPKQAANWTTTYETHALSAMMDVVTFVKIHSVKKVKTQTLALLSPLDNVVSVKKSEEEVNKIPGSIIKWIQSNDHILAGDIISPATTAQVTQLILNFIRCDKECSSKL
jgi:esterase/lipase